MSPFPKYFSKTDKPVMQLRTSIRLRFLVADFGLTPVKRATETISFTTKGIIRRGRIYHYLLGPIYQQLNFLHIGGRIKLHWQTPVRRYNLESIRHKLHHGFTNTQQLTDCKKIHLNKLALRSSGGYQSGHKISVTPLWTAVYSPVSELFICGVSYCVI